MRCEIMFMRRSAHPLKELRMSYKHIARIAYHALRTEQALLNGVDEAVQPYPRLRKGIEILSIPAPLLPLTVLWAGAVQHLVTREERGPRTPSMAQS